MVVAVKMSAGVSGRKRPTLTRRVEMGTGTGPVRSSSVTKTSGTAFKSSGAKFVAEEV